jgi:hypothetical protein
MSSRVPRHALLGNRRQLAAVAGGFVLAIALLESRGFVVWAERLEVGALQQQFENGARAFDRALEPLGLAAWRPRALSALAQAGWSDLPQDDHPGQGQATQVADAPTTAAEPVPVSAATVAGRAPTSLGAQALPAVASSPAAALPPPSAFPLASAAPLAPVALQQPFPEPAGPRAIAALQGRAALTPLPPASTARPRVVALAGDSLMAVGLGVQLQRDLLPYRNSIVTLKAYRSATGLARPEVFDWLSEYPLMLQHQRPDVVIAAIGANDGQGFVEQGVVRAFGSPEWHAAYARRVEDYLAMLTRDGALVLWVQMPPMRLPRFNARMQVINEIAYAAVARNPRAIWWNPTARLADAEGQFREFAPLADGRKTVRIRSEDGIHLSDEGAGLITPELVQWLHPAPPSATSAAR